MEKLYIVTIATYSEPCLESLKPIVCRSRDEAIKVMTDDVMRYVQTGDIYQYSIETRPGLSGEDYGSAYIIWNDDTVYEYLIYEVECPGIIK